MVGVTSLDPIGEILINFTSIYHAKIMSSSTKCTFAQSTSGKEKLIFIYSNVSYSASTNCQIDLFLLNAYKVNGKF